MAKNTWIGVQSRGSAADSASQIGMVGTDCSSSISRWITRSIDAAEIAGDAAEHDAEDDAERDRNEPDGHRGLGAAHDARPLVTPEPIGAEQEDALAGIGRADQMDVGRNRPSTR